PIIGVLKVDRKAGETLTAQDIARYPQPPGTKVVTQTIKNWFPLVEAKVSVPRPLGYVIPGTHADVVETLLEHGIAVDMFLQDRTVELEASEVRDIVPAAADYLAPEKIIVERKALAMVVRRGDFFVSCGQEAATLIPCLLEPESEFGFIRYWKHGLVPKAGDVYAILRLVKSQVLPLVPYKPWAR
ncbi:MAG TPA: hypothetical protein VEG35_04615, partial [Burkholderiales bacterium]|nr:hypothetical protein [Burkholderiales bacterium]